MRSYAALFAAFAVAAVSAQSTNYTSSLNMTINPGTVDESTRATWCTAQGNTCKSLCSGRTAKNDCIYTDLSYECTCSANNSAPGLQYYTQTMPTFICDTLLAQCYKQNENSQDGQQACKDDIGSLCATQSPPTSSSDSSSSSTSASSATGSATGSATQTTQAAASTTSDKGFAAATAIPKHAAAAVAAGALFALL